jgi:hypothetical protein
MVAANFHAAWIGFLLGALAGATQGLYFHDDAWLGGYGSWRRRLLRLGHISFFGLGFVNLGFALSEPALRDGPGLAWASTLFIVGAATMPLICYLSAFRKAFRHLFFIPVLSVLGGIVVVIGTTSLP